MMLDPSTLDRLLNAVSGLFVLFRPDADFTIVSASADFFSTTRTDTSICGRPIFDIFPDNPNLTGANGATNLSAALGTVIATKTRLRMEPQRYDLPLPEALGGGFEERYWNITVTPMLGSDGEVEYIINQVEEASAKHKRDAIQILESITEGFFTLDRGWRFDYVNHEAHRILGQEVGALAGKVLWEVYPGLEGTDFEKSYHRTMFDREKVSFIAFYPHQQRWYDVTTSPAPEGISVYFRNVTEQKAVEAEREAATKVLREHAQRLAEADTVKDDFLATLSHELRNPLAPLRTAIELLQRQGGTDASSDRLLAMMARQVAHMVRLMDDLLEMSRISRGTLFLQHAIVDLASVVSNALEATDPQIKAAGHTLTIELPPTPVYVDGDPIRLAQILINLLNNAARYTDDGGAIWLRAAARDGKAIFEVQDNGIGIAPELQARLFEMFTRGDRLSARHQGGLGIGLALSRRLAEMHGGTVELESAGSGHGSKFTVQLPLAVEVHTVPATQSAVPARSSELTILVVDDNIEAADTLAMLLDTMQAYVRVAYSGQGGLELLAGWQPDVALLDIGMPGMNGFELARAIRRMFPHAPPTMIAVTGWGQESDRQQARDAGFAHHLVKPCRC